MSSISIAFTNEIMLVIFVLSFWFFLLTLHTWLEVTTKRNVKPKGGV